MFGYFEYLLPTRRVTHFNDPSFLYSKCYKMDAGCFMGRFGTHLVFITR